MAEGVGVKVTLLPQITSEKMQEAVTSASGKTKALISGVTLSDAAKASLTESISKAAQKVTINSIKVKKIDASDAVASLKTQLESIFGSLQTDSLKLSINDGQLTATYKRIESAAGSAAKGTSNIGTSLDIAKKKAAALESTYNSMLKKLNISGNGGTVRELELTNEYEKAATAVQKYVDVAKSGNAEAAAAAKSAVDKAVADFSSLIEKYNSQATAIKQYTSQVTALKKTASNLKLKDGIDAGKLEDFNLKIADCEQQINSLGSMSQAEFTATASGIENAIQSTKEFGSQIASTATVITSNLKPVYTLLNQVRSYRDANSKILGSGYDTQLSSVEKSLNAIIDSGSYAKTSLTDLQAEFSRIKVEADAAGFSGKNFVAEISKIATAIGQSMVLRQLFVYAKQGAIEVYNAVRDVDDAMTQLKIVTGATGNEMVTFFKQAVSSAKELGTSVSDVLDSIQVFSRLGLT